MFLGQARLVLGLALALALALNPLINALPSTSLTPTRPSNSSIFQLPIYWLNLDSMPHRSRSMQRHLVSYPLPLFNTVQTSRPLSLSLPYLSI